MRTFRIFKVLILVFFAELVNAQEKQRVELVVLGTVQDGGLPHLGCQKSCCVNENGEPQSKQEVSSLGLIIDDKTFIFDATPDFVSQQTYLNGLVNKNKRVVDGVFLTHAHIGHYTGLMFLGREAMNADSVSVYAGDEMRNFLGSNGPWSQLVELGNIRLEDAKKVSLSHSVKVESLVVPHRDEFSETLGFVVYGPSKTVLFIPDIDKWEKWNLSIAEWIQKVDYAFLDATFYGPEEVGRDMSEIPHPFALESMNALKALDKEQRSKVYFIHMNHTNPLLDAQSDAYRFVLSQGYHIAKPKEQFSL